MHRYHAFGFDVASDVPLETLLPARSEGPPSVHIRLGLVGALDANMDGTPHHISHDQMQFDFPSLGRFRVSGGREIVVEPAPDADPDFLRTCLLGPVLAAVLHQRGLLVLHASAVLIDGTAVALLGSKGWGKSTLAAALRARGHSLIADDVSAVDTSAGTPKVFPAFPQLKLWPQTVTALGLDASALPRLRRNMEKRSYHVDTRFHVDPVSLGCLYVLEVGDSLAIEPLDRRDAFSELVRHTYFLRYLESSGATVRHFDHCASLVRRVKVFRIVRPPSLGLLDATATLVEEHGHTDRAAVREAIDASP
jgi:hypothetical protein